MFDTMSAIRKEKSFLFFVDKIYNYMIILVCNQERGNIMNKTIKELKQLINKAYYMSNDSRISLYIRVMEILDYYDENTTIERKMQIKKEYGIGDDK